MVETLRVNGAMAPRDHHLIETTRRLLDPGLPEKALPTPGVAPDASETMAGDNPRNTGPMRASLRCGAKTRSGRPCRSPAVSGKRRCRMHGGAPGSGAPCGNKNALKSGLCTREALEERRRLRDFLRQARSLIKDI
jgi:hypothetical protein